MKLYERVKLLAKQHGLSVKDLAEKLGVPASTFNHYFNEKTEHNLFNYLEKIITICPGANKVWLYCEEGAMLTDDGEHVIAQPFTTALPPMRSAPWHGQEEIADEVAALRMENSLLKDKLIAALEDNKLLHEQLARVEALDPRMAGEGKIFTPPAGDGHGAPGVSVHQSDFTEK